MKRLYIHLISFFVFGIFIAFSCQKKSDSTPDEIKGSSNTVSSNSTTGGGSTTGNSTTGGSTTGGSTTGGSTTGGATQKGTIIFHKPENYYDLIYLDFKGSYKGTLESTARHSNPSCNTNGCITITNLSYGNYSYSARVYAANGTTVVKTESGTVNLNAPCVAQSVSP